jgi:hypothetical protein
MRAKPWITACYNFPMPNFYRAAVASIRFVAVVALLGVALASAQKEAPPQESAPDVPDAIAVPSGEDVVLFAHASGSQIYTCSAGTDGKPGWTLKGPDAELKDRKDKVIGQHSAGPVWKLKDGSEVTGKAVGHVDSLDADSIPWLLVQAVNHAGSGQLGSVTYIQRVHTHGGKAPAEGCDAAHLNAESKSGYTADYYFFAAAK